MVHENPCLLPNEVTKRTSVVSAHTFGSHLSDVIPIAQELRGNRRARTTAVPSVLS
jgi:hypothetical protein